MEEISDLTLSLYISDNENTEHILTNTQETLANISKQMLTQIRNDIKTTTNKNYKNIKKLKSQLTDFNKENQNQETIEIINKIIKSTDTLIAKNYEYDLPSNKTTYIAKLIELS
jgi:hypothetical protein